jgi:soluble lytic murein transglycosylase
MTKKVLSSAVILFLFFTSIILSSLSLCVPRDTLQIPDPIRHWHETAYSGPANIPTALKQGKDAFSEERYAAALEILPGRDEVKNLLLGDYIMLYRAKSNLQMQRYPEALEDYRFLEKQFPQSRFHRDAFIGQCQILLELNDPNAVFDLLEKNKPYSGSEVLFYKARALDLNGKNDQAIALYLQVYSQYASSYSAQPAERYLLSLEPHAFKGANNYSLRLQRAENLLRANSNTSARTLLVALGKFSAPDKKTSQKQKLLLAEAEYNLNKTAAALAVLKTVSTTDPLLHAKALYLEGSCRRRLKQEAAFIALRDKALDLYPKSPDTEALCYSVATYYDVEYESEKASNAYRVLSNAFPKGRHAERAQWKSALTDYFAGQWDNAIRGFWNYLLEHTGPLSASSAMYWMGRCYAKRGNIEEARYLFNRTQTLANESYYGRRAREAAAVAAPDPSGNSAGNPIAGVDFKKVKSVCDSIRYAPVIIAEPDINGIRILERAKQLTTADLPDLALSELRWGIQQYPQNHKVFYFIMSLLSAAKENFNGVFSYMKYIIPDYSGLSLDTFTDDILYMLYPIRYLEFISEQASGLAPALILGVIRQESGFNPNAQSGANARGLMQLLPSTALRLARNAGLPRSTAKNLYDAENNIKLGTLHLSYLMKKYGKVEPILAAYNAGESRSDRWLQEFGNADMAEFVEQIPFSETRNYVKQILSNQYHYDALISRSTSTSLWETQ